jgi:hypothetical protein
MLVAAISTRRDDMGIGVSLILIAVGAILTWAVEVSTSGINIDAVGVILMIVGLVGFILSLAFWSTWWGPGYFRRTVTTVPSTVRRRRTSAPRTYVEENTPDQEIIEERY